MQNRKTQYHRGSLAAGKMREGSNQRLAARRGFFAWKDSWSSRASNSAREKTKATLTRGEMEKKRKDQPRGETALKSSALVYTRDPGISAQLSGCASHG